MGPPKRHDPWDDFEPVRRERQKSLGPIGFVLVLLVIMAGGAAIGAVAGALYAPGATRNQRLDYQMNTTAEEAMPKVIIGAIIGAVLAGGSFIGMKIKSLRGE